MMGSTVGTIPVCTADLEPFTAGFLIPHTGHQNVNLKRTAQYFSSKDGFIQDQQRIEIQGLQPWQAACKSPHERGKRLLFQGKRGLWRATVNKESMVFYWLSLCQEKESFFFLLGSAISTGYESSHFSLLTLIEASSSLLIFYISLF